MNKASILTAILALLPCIATAKDVSIDSGSVTFVVPDDFTELSQAEINAKYPSVNAPKQVIGAEGRATTIAYQLHAQSVKESDLPDVQKAFTQVFDRVIPGIEWKQQRPRGFGWPEVVVHGDDVTSNRSGYSQHRSDYVTQRQDAHVQF
jgi:hypothetical protein